MVHIEVAQIFVFGARGNMCSLDYSPGMTVEEAILTAGFQAPSIHVDGTTVLRRTGSEERTISVAHKNLANFELLPSDQIWLTESGRFPTYPLGPELVPKVRPKV